MDSFADQINVSFALSPLRIYYYLSSQRQIGENLVQRVEIVKKRSLWGYKGDDWVPFFKLTITGPKSLPKVRDEYSHRKNAAAKAYVHDYAYLKGQNSHSGSSTGPSILMKVILPIPFGS